MGQSTVDPGFVKLVFKLADASAASRDDEDEEMVNLRDEVVDIEADPELELVEAGTSTPKLTPLVTLAGHHPCLMSIALVEIKIAPLPVSVVQSTQLKVNHG